MKVSFQRLTHVNGATNSNPFLFRCEKNELHNLVMESAVKDISNIPFFPLATNDAAAMVSGNLITSPIIAIRLSISTYRIPNLADSVKKNTCPEKSFNAHLKKNLSTLEISVMNKSPNPIKEF